MNALDEAIVVAGRMRENTGKSGITYLSDVLGVTRQQVNRLRKQWRETGAAPAPMLEHAPKIERAIAGAVKSEALYPAVTWIRDAEGRVTHYTVPVQPAKAA